MGGAGLLLLLLQLGHGVERQALLLHPRRERRAAPTAPTHGRWAAAAAAAAAAATAIAAGAEAAHGGPGLGLGRGRGACCRGLPRLCMGACIMCLSGRGSITIRYDTM